MSVMLGNFKDSVADLMARMGLEPPQGKDLDTQVMALLQRARQSAVKGGSGPNAGSGALGQDLQFSMGDSGQPAAPGDNGTAPPDPEGSAASGGDPAATPPSPGSAVPPGPVLSVEQSKQLITNVTALAAQGPLTPRQQADLDQAKKVVAQDTVNRLQGQTATLSEAQKQELAEAQGVLGQADTAARKQDNQSINPGPSLTFPPSPHLEWNVTFAGDRHLRPEAPYDVNRKPKGAPKVLHPNDTDAGNIRGCAGDNEAALVLAQNGYDYEAISKTGVKKDGKIQGTPDGTFAADPESKSDIYSPVGTKKVRGIYDEVVKKVDVQNAPYVIVRIEPGGQSIAELTDYFKRHPIEGLKQLFVVKEGKLYIVY